MTLSADRRQRAGVVGLPFHCEACPLSLGEHVPSDQIVILVVLDQQDLSRSVGWSAMHLSVGQFDDLEPVLRPGAHDLDQAAEGHRLGDEGADPEVVGTRTSASSLEVVSTTTGIRRSDSSALISASASRPSSWAC